MKRLSWTMVFVFLVAASPAVQAGLFSGLQADQINIGADGSGKLKVVYDGDPITLPEVHDMGFDGFRSDEPGFYSIANDHPIAPNDDFFKLVPGTMLRLVVTIDFDPPLRGYEDGTFTNYFAVADDMWEMGIGEPGTDVHPFWSVDMNDPKFTGGPWVATYKIVEGSDKGYTDSDNYFINFTPEPGSLGLLLIGMFACRRRRSCC